MVKIPRNTAVAIYQPYWIRYISLQHGWVDRYYGPPCSPAYAISHCSYRSVATFTNSTQFMVKIEKKNTIFAIYRPYWICHISLQHGWVDWYYGPPCSSAYVISYCSCIILATSTNSPQFMVEIPRNTAVAIYQPYWIRYISLQHGWVDRYYGPLCSPGYAISHFSYRSLATFSNSTQFMVKI